MWWQNCQNKFASKRVFVFLLIVLKIIKKKKTARKSRHTYCNLNYLLFAKCSISGCSIHRKFICVYVCLMIKSVLNNKKDSFSSVDRADHCARARALTKRVNFQIRIIKQTNGDYWRRRRCRYYPGLFLDGNNKSSSVVVKVWIKIQYQFSMLLMHTLIINT